MFRFVLPLAALWLFIAPSFLSAQDLRADPEDVELGNREYSPNLNQNYPMRVFWGDTHVHTSYSTDAGMIGNRLDPEEAYRFAIGEEVVSSTGVRTRLLRPLDFLVVADHAENLGLAPLIEESNSSLLRIAWGKRVHDLVKAGKGQDAYAVWGDAMGKREDPISDKEVERTMWQRITAFAEEYNQPGNFTAFVGFEWTSSPAGSNLHRNVIFRDGKQTADRVVPLSNYDTSDPEELWNWMEEYEAKTGGRMLAIPHNGNLSNGLMFDVVTLTDKRPLDRDYALRRMRWEPLYEVTQIKGDGEAHPSLSPNDEFADFGTWDRGSFGAAKDPDMIPKEYAREAYKRGLQFEESLGANPFKFGMIGSSDTHTSLATFEENNNFGKAPIVEPCKECFPGRFEEKITGYLPSPDGRDYAIYHIASLSGGLAGVWARENTRASLFDAMERKEAYATTGTRITVRVFGGWDFTEADVLRPDFAKTGYERGTPMGGDLSSAPNGEAPKFMIRALRDPDGANLDRIQIIKGWMDSDGELHERVYDVVVTDGRTINGEGRCTTPVGNTVDVEKATYTNDIGEALLMGYWEDPDFDPYERAFYYVRVLEIPTPRWSTYDAAFYGLDLPDEESPFLQERAYTSPIWFTPQ